MENEVEVSEEGYSVMIAASDYVAEFGEDKFMEVMTKVMASVLIPAGHKGVKHEDGVGVLEFSASDELLEFLREGLEDEDDG